MKNEERRKPPMIVSKDIENDNYQQIVEEEQLGPIQEEAK